MILRFSDGMAIDTSGDYRIIRESDGLYVTGRGFLSAVDSYEEGKALIAKIESVRAINGSESGV